MGGVFIFFGFLVLLFSIEICVRLRKNAKRVKDPSIDKLKNLHQIKHWMEPGEDNIRFNQTSRKHGRNGVLSAPSSPKS